MTDAPDPILAALRQEREQAMRVLDPYRMGDDLVLTCRQAMEMWIIDTPGAIQAQLRRGLAADATLARVQAALTHCRKRINAWVDDDRQGSSEAVTLLCDIAEWIDAALAPQTPNSQEGA